jgi:hypothetical protein
MSKGRLTFRGFRREWMGTVDVMQPGPWGPVRIDRSHWSEHVREGDSLTVCYVGDPMRFNGGLMDSPSRTLVVYRGGDTSDNALKACLNYRLVGETAGKE